MAMKILKVGVALMLCGLSVLLLSCASESESTPQSQTVTVHRGNLVLYVTGTGNLALSRTEDLAFDMAGTVSEVLVSVADSVEEGRVVATLDTSEWETNLASLQASELQAEINLKNAELNLEQAEEDTSTSITGDIVTGRTTDPEEIDILEIQVTLAEKRLADAQKALADAQDASPEVTAPFDGFITQVNVSGGDEIKKGTVAVQLADPTKFEADILVSEIDISGVKLGGDATVGMDAITGVTLPAKVTFIAPTATIQSGVVNYKVTVEVTSLQPIRSSQFAQRGTTGSAQGGQEQTSGQTAAGQESQAAASQTVQLRQGLSTTVNIPVQERDDVLLIPNRAITRQQGVSYVQVLNSDGTTEQRKIQTGITDFQNTEVTDGLTEGEKVVIPQTTTTNTTTSQQEGRPPGGGIFFRGG